MYVHVYTKIVINLHIIRYKLKEIAMNVKCKRSDQLIVKLESVCVSAWTVHEQTQSNRACSILQFCRVGLSFRGISLYPFFV
jgi:hypothetical protein